MANKVEPSNYPLRLAEQDEKLAFGGFANALRKCRTDFGVEIDIDVSRIRTDPRTSYSSVSVRPSHVRAEQTPSGPE